MSVAWLLIALGPLLVMATVYVASGGFGGRSGGILRGILLIDIVYLLTVVSLVGWSVMRIMAARRAKSAGSRLHMRLSGVFAIVALIPTVLVAVFAVLTLNLGVEGWFSENVRSVVGSSLNAATAYKEEQRGDLEEDLSFIAFNLEQYKRQNTFVTDGDIRAQLSRLQSSVQRGLKEAYLIDGAGKIQSRGEFSYLFDFEQPSPLDLERATNGKMVILEDWENNEFRALIRLRGFADRYLYISRSVDGNILNLLDETTATAKTYTQMETQRGQILSYYGLLYLGFASFVILSAIWLGMLFAERLSRPVGQLAGAAQRVGAGDFNVQVSDISGDDEIAMLGRAFNRMTKQVKRQHTDLRDAHAYTERRRRLFDSVLTGVTAGVLGLSSDGRITIVNSAAIKLLNLDESCEGTELALAVPEFAPLLAKLDTEDSATAQQEISLTRAGNAEVLLVRISTRQNELGENEGYVITFDDVTDLVSAQRMAAWGDVARRIAHEIKNPLTPIQLSAERLQRKFGPLVGEQKQSLVQYSDVIIRQTNDLRRIVDEFSKFARMPEPQKSPANLSKLISDAVLLQRTAAPNVIVKLENTMGDISAEIDETMISQALNNLMKNALEAIEAKRASNPPKSYRPQLRVIASVIGEGVEILIQDNGIGLPSERRSRLFEPYVTHRKDGTGLGLSIVKKIIEEHGGTLDLSDAPKFTKTGTQGAMARIYLPKIIQMKPETRAAEVA
ncbi:ATP-binding protein [Amylibacter marinus]